jgi:hypothetical protein
MRILFINNDGGGFAAHIEVGNGTTVSSLMAQRLPGRKPEDYLIRVNRLPVKAMLLWLLHVAESIMGIIDETITERPAKAKG